MFLLPRSTWISCAFAIAVAIGVRFSALGSIQTARLNVCSTRPPAPSDTFFRRSPTLEGLSAMRLMLTRSSPASGGANADPTVAP